uniref:Uncharacterized protein n=1 Tax=Oryza meridionalis TaxID=40149 RepID=A0A0E0F7C8_9ORYZ
MACQPSPPQVPPSPAATATATTTTIASVAASRPDPAGRAARVVGVVEERRHGHDVHGRSVDEGAVPEVPRGGEVPCPHAVRRALARSGDSGIASMIKTTMTNTTTPVTRFKRNPHRRMKTTTHDFPGLSPNCVYITDDSLEYINYSRRNNKRDIGVWSIEDQKLQSLGGASPIKDPCL